MKVIQNDLIKINSANFEKDAKGIIQKHQEILQFCQDFNNVCVPIIIQKLVSTTYSMCVMGFSAMVVNKFLMRICCRDFI